MLTPIQTTLTPSEQRRELLKCASSYIYFIVTYVKIYDPALAQWIPFILWDFQEDVIHIIHQHPQVIGLKARQVGLTWLALAYALWLMLFRPIAEVLLFSKREDEAIYLLSDERLRGMYDRLPSFMQSKSILIDDRKHLRLSNGSGARAFPSNAGDSYTATYALIDEADLVPDLNKLLRSVSPTVEAGGKLVLISRADKSSPASYFKLLYMGAVQGKNNWYGLFVPWYAHPGRDAAWHARQSADYTPDDLAEQYPSTDAEALSARTTDKLLISNWVESCYQPIEPIEAPDAPAISGLLIYRLPERGHNYVVGVDSAEGKEHSDDSAISVVNVETFEEVCHLSGRIEFSILAGYADQIGQWFNKAQVMIERSNHGHAVILWFKEHSRLRLLLGHDGDIGWLSSPRGKHILYSETAEDIKAGKPLIHTPKVYHQLLSIERATLRAPQGLKDDAADSFAFSVVARRRFRRITSGVI